MPGGGRTDKKDKTQLSDSSADGYSSQLDDRLLDRFDHMISSMSKSLIEAFNSCVTQVAKTIEDKFAAKFDAQTTENNALHRELETLGRRCAKLQADNKELRAGIMTISTRLDHLSAAQGELEQYSRVDNILIHGIPLPQTGQTEDLVRSVPDIINQHMSNIHLTSDQISTVHRLSPPKHSTAPNSAGVSNKPPAVVVRFTRRQVKHSILSNRKVLKGKGITVSEDLSLSRVQLLKSATNLVAAHKLQGAWSHEGKILIKTHQNRTLTILTEADLQQFQ